MRVGPDVQIDQHSVFKTNFRESIKFNLALRVLSFSDRLCMKTIILPVVLYGCKTWSLTLREEYRLRVFENRILRRIFVPKTDENGEWKRLQNEERHSLYH